MKSKNIIIGVGMLLCLVFFNLPDAAGQSRRDSERVRQEKEDADKGKCWVIRHPMFARDCWARKIKNGGGDKNFHFAKLSRMSLYGANLTEALLSQADLTEANLTEANLTKAQMIGANLTKAMLNGTNLTEANLKAVNFTKADLSIGMVWNPVGAILTGAELDDADLTGADLTGADLTNARLDGAILTGAIVSRSKTKGIDFEDWKSRGAIIRD